VTNHYK